VNPWQLVQPWLHPKETMLDQSFSLSDRGEQPGVEEQAPVRLADARLRTEGVLNQIDSLLRATPGGKAAVEKVGDLSTSLDENVTRLKAVFRMPENKDLIIRDLRIATQPPTRAVVCFMEGLADKITVNAHILKPLMLLAHLDHHVDGQGEDGPTTFTIDTILQRLLPGHQVSQKYTMEEIAQSLLSGDSVLLFESERTAVVVETKGFPSRSVSPPQNEKVVLGPQDGFTEAWRVNAALVRRRLKDPRVVTEILTVGEVSHTYVGMMYIDSIASPKLVAEVKRRVESLRVDIVTDAGILEQYISDNPGSFLPSTLITERPDRTAAYLSEGHVALLVDNSPQAIISPITFWGLLQTAEDYYLRWPFATFLRYIRFIAMITAVVGPALYAAALNYHQEMIPTELMLFIANSRENVPMPSVVELVLMDLTFELIREAGLRIPSPFGPTIGLVASLVLGQAAVSARIVSPLMIIVVAIAGLASFAIPSYIAGFGIRSFRFVFLVAAAILGFYGIAAVGFLTVLYLAGLRSFGVPFLSPVAPNRGGAADILTRQPMFAMELRPAFVRTPDRRRQPAVVRAWDPVSREQAGSDSSKKGDGRS